MDKKEIGQYIKTRRKSLKVNQPILAELSGVGLNTLVAVERGSGNPGLDTIMAILDTLGLQIKLDLKD